MLSVPHLVVLFLIALMVFGPEKLPELARTLGKAMAEFRRMTGDVRRVVEDEMREIERQTRINDAKKLEAAAPVQSPPQLQPAASPASDPGAQSAPEQGAPPGTVPAEKPTNAQPPVDQLPDDMPTIQQPFIAKPGAVDPDPSPADASRERVPEPQSEQDFSHVKHNPS